MAPPGVAIEIHGMADTSSRMNLKKLMEQFGEVIGCHIGNRGVDKPVVRFPTQECGDTALAALKNNQVWLDGVILSGDWQKSAPAPEPEAALMTSRDLLSSRRGGGKGGGRSRSRGGGGGGGSTCPGQASNCGCDWTHKIGCSSDDGSECHCRCCCEHQGGQCIWQR
mmetsp:Transcript_54616/g.154771  ORF Transcript_54616/g.154771 Transcript_54616/m.154771 type:complete len:167 (-) Transcript_54616:29-529(-)